MAGSISGGSVFGGAIEGAEITDETITQDKFKPRSKVFPFCLESDLTDHFNESVVGTTSSTVSNGECTISVSGGGNNSIEEETTEDFARTSGRTITLIMDVDVDYTNGELADTGNELDFGFQNVAQNRSVKFRKIPGTDGDDEISAVVYDGTTVTSESNITFTRNQINRVKIIITNTAITFYINGTLKKTVSSDLPAGNMAVVFYAKRDADEAANAATVGISYAAVWVT